MEAQRFDDAARMLDDAEQAHGPAPEFSAMRRRAAAEREKQERAEAVRRALEEPIAFSNRTSLNLRSSSLDAALTRYPGILACSSFAPGPSGR